jgi:hypothetical protein
MAYLGNVKPTETTSSVLRSTYTGDGSTTTFNLPGPVANETSIIATINGVTQQDAAYTTNGSQIIFSGAPALGDSIELRTISGVGLSYAPSAGSVTTGILADGAVTTGKINDASVTGAKLGTGAAVANIGARAITAAQVPAGSVLQVVQAKFDTFAYTSSATFSSTGYNVQITPTAASSKVLVMFNSPAYLGGSSRHMYSTIYRNSTNLAPTSTGELALTSSGTTAGSGWQQCSMHILDSPNTTSLTTYTVYFRSLDTNQVYFGEGASWQVITAMEIAG